MRPDLYYIMVEAYYYREQKAWLPIRRLSAIVANLIRGEDDPIVKDSDIEWLTLIDKPLPPPIKSAPVVWSKEDLEKFYKEYNVTSESNG